MAIQMRRGLYADFDPSKMTPGEWGVSIDSDTSKHVIWMCFSPGFTKRMGTYEDFSADIQTILEPYILEMESSVTSCATSETNASTSESNALVSETNSNAYATSSRSYAVGDTASRTGESTDNSKYYSEQAENYHSLITDAISANIPTFIIDENMHLISTGGTITFSLNAENHLLWEVTV